MSAEDVAAMHAHMESFHKGLVESGELVDTRGLTAPVHARRVQLRNGVPVVTDGPYPETQEVLAGYTIVDCESFRPGDGDRRGPGEPGRGREYVDVRPILDSVRDLEAYPPP